MDLAVLKEARMAVSILNLHDFFIQQCDISTTQPTHNGIREKLESVCPFVASFANSVTVTTCDVVLLVKYVKYIFSVNTLKSKTPYNPRYSPLSTLCRKKLDHYTVLNYPLTTESTIKKIEDNDSLAFIVDVRVDKKNIMGAMKIDKDPLYVEGVENSDVK